MDRLFLLFYTQPMDMAYLEMGIMLVLWTVFMIILRGKARKAAGIIFTALAVFAILFVTVIKRSPAEQGVNYIPLYTFKLAKAQPELIRTMEMNVFLFMPFGMSFPFFLPEKLRLKLLLTVSVALLFSACVECAQYFLSLGMFDIDDVICNTLGAFIGFIPFAVCTRVDGFLRRHKEKRG